MLQIRNLRKILASVRVLMREYGVKSTLLFVIYRLKPHWFSLVNIKAFPSEQNPLSVNKDVYDYLDWSEYGGAVAPCCMNENQMFSKTYIWFVPDWLNVWGGGHFTLFRFANHFAKHGTRNIIYIYDNRRHFSPNKLQNELDEALVDCKIEVVVDPKKLPIADGAIATTWQSAYSVRSFPYAKKKFYFMQDYESLFYAHGTASMQANATYQFGFAGITGGNWLKSCYEGYGGEAKSYRFAADRSIFYPFDKDGTVREKVKKIFFYGRPSTERRCFSLGIAALDLIAKKFPEIEIVIAGLEMTAPRAFGATLLGNLTLAETGDLYRTCDIGIAFSGTNLSYLPVELMASGVPVISNSGPHVEWHCKNEYNCILVDPTPRSVLDAVTRLVTTRELRQAIANGGLETMKNLSWDDQMEDIYNYSLSVIDHSCDLVSQD